jgi:hypothetical protein
MRGTVGHWSELKRSMVTLGLMLYPVGRDSFYVCWESGLSHLSLKSTYDPLSDVDNNKWAGVIAIGVEGRLFYFEVGFEVLGFPTNWRLAEEDYADPRYKNYITRRADAPLKRYLGGTMALSFGLKF